MNAIGVANLSKTYGDVQAVSDLSFQVREGAIYGFLGPNGAGKTTTIKIILQLIVSYRGEVTLLGQKVNRDTSVELRKQIGYLPQEPVFPAKFTGLEVLDFVSRNYNLNATMKSKRIAELLDQFNLADAKNRMVDGYSKGMKQRLGLAAALLPKPRLLILDEPASALDPRGRREVLDSIRLQKGKTTVFFSSHILADVEEICEYVSVLHHGEKIVEDSVENLLATYAPAQYEVVTKQINNPQEIEQLLTQFGITDLEITDRVIRFGFRRDQTDTIITQVLSGLLKQGVIVEQFAPVRTNLEEVFFKLLDQKAASQQLTQGVRE